MWFYWVFLVIISYFSSQLQYINTRTFRAWGGHNVSPHSDVCNVYDHVQLICYWVYVPESNCWGTCPSATASGLIPFTSRFNWVNESFPTLMYLKTFGRTKVPSSDLILQSHVPILTTELEIYWSCWLLNNFCYETFRYCISKHKTINVHHIRFGYLLVERVLSHGEI